jgi:hypothetical protein
LFMRKFWGLALAGVFAASVAIAQTLTLPQVNSIGGGDLFQDVVNGQPNAQSQYASALTLSGYVGSLPARSNALVAGDASQNLFQRATTGASVTTTVTYGGPDRWAYWSGTSTAMTVSRDSTAADLPSSAYKYAYKMARTSGQTGVVQVCMAQEVESVNTYQFQGATAELDFHAVPGANYSAASSAMTAYIITGTGTDEGMSDLAFGLNAGGGGGAGWAGQANAAAAVITLGNGAGRYAAVGAIPVGATEIGVALCFTPVGTAGTNDYIAFSGIQLTRNMALTSKASATVGYSCDNSANAQIQCTSFDRTRQYAVEAQLQQRYYYEIDEGAATTQRGTCFFSTANTTAQCLISFPVTMRIAPTVTYTAGFALETTTAFTALNNCTGLANNSTITGYAPNVSNVLATCTNGGSTTAAVGLATQLMDNGGGGKIKAAAEL